MTRRLGVIKTLIVLTACACFFSPSWAASPTFPDRLSFSHVPGVHVEMLAYENMAEVSLTPEEIKAHVVSQLVKAGVTVDQGNQLRSQAHSPKKGRRIKPDGMAILGVKIRRTEDSAMFVAKIGSVAVMLHLFQRVIIGHNQHATHAITWSESRSILGGSKRPKKILEALDALVAKFVGDFRATPSKPQ